MAFVAKCEVIANIMRRISHCREPKNTMIRPTTRAARLPFRSNIFRT